MRGVRAVCFVSSRVQNVSESGVLCPRFIVVFCLFFLSFWVISIFRFRVFSGRVVRSGGSRFAFRLCWIDIGEWSYEFW